MISHELFWGIDLGASATKAIVLDSKGMIIGKSVVQSRMNFRDSANDAIKHAMTGAGIYDSDMVFTVSTGYGRKNVEFSQMIKTEISCHGKGVYHYFPEPLTIIDIGSQDNKLIHINGNGVLKDFKMNRKCAAGTGAFLEEIAHRTGMDISGMDALARKSSKNIEIGSYCTVFSMTEVLTMCRQGIELTDIVKAVFRSMAKRIGEMGALSGKIIATGGVIAHNPVMIDLLSETLNSSVLSTPDPLYTGALGAALYAFEEFKK